MREWEREYSCVSMDFTFLIASLFHIIVIAPRWIDRSRYARDISRLYFPSVALSPINTWCTIRSERNLQDHYLEMRIISGISIHENVPLKDFSIRNKSMTPRSFVGKNFGFLRDLKKSVHCKNEQRGKRDVPYWWSSIFTSLHTLKQHGTPRERRMSQPAQRARHKIGLGPK